MSALFDPYEITRRLIKAKQDALDYEMAKVLKDILPTEWALIGPATCIAETSKAILVEIVDKDTYFEGWIPKSQLHPEENEIGGRGHSGMLVIPVWLAKEKGWL